MPTQRSRSALFRPKMSSFRQRTDKGQVIGFVGGQGFAGAGTFSSGSSLTPARAAAVWYKLEPIFRKYRGLARFIGRIIARNRALERRNPNRVTSQRVSTATNDRIGSQNRHNGLQIRNNIINRERSRSSNSGLRSDNVRTMTADTRRIISTGPDKSEATRNIHNNNRVDDMNFMSNAVGLGRNSHNIRSKPVAFSASSTTRGNSNFNGHTANSDTLSSQPNVQNSRSSSRFADNQHTHNNQHTSIHHNNDGTRVTDSFVRQALNRLVHTLKDQVIKRTQTPNQGSNTTPRRLFPLPPRPQTQNNVFIIGNQGHNTASSRGVHVITPDKLKQHGLHVPNSYGQGHNVVPPVPRLNSHRLSGGTMVHVVELDRGFTTSSNRVAPERKINTPSSRTWSVIGVASSDPKINTANTKTSLPGAVTIVNQVAQPRRLEPLALYHDLESINGFEALGENYIDPYLYDPYFDPLYDPYLGNQVGKDPSVLLPTDGTVDITAVDTSGKRSHTVTIVRKPIGTASGNTGLAKTTIAPGSTTEQEWEMENEGGATTTTAATVAASTTTHASKVVIRKSILKPTRATTTPSSKVSSVRKAANEANTSSSKVNTAKSSGAKVKTVMSSGSVSVKDPLQ